MKLYPNRENCDSEPSESQPWPDKNPKPTLALSIMCRKYETGFPVHETEPFNGSILETCMIVPMSETKRRKKVNNDDLRFRRPP